MKYYYKITKVENDIDIFPDYIRVRVMAVENGTNLIRLFISKPFFINNKWTKEQTQTKIEIFVDKFVGSINIRQAYDLIKYNENLKFTKYKSSRLYNRCLIDSNGNLKKEMFLYGNIL